jgi:hypothetical protein
MHRLNAPMIWRLPILVGLALVAAGPWEPANAGHPFGLQLPWPSGLHRINEFNNAITAARPIWG